MQRSLTYGLPIMTAHSLNHTLKSPNREAVFSSSWNFVLSEVTFRTQLGREGDRTDHDQGSFIFLKASMPVFVSADSSFICSGSMVVKLKQDLPCMRFRSAGEIPFRSCGAAYTGIR